MLERESTTENFLEYSVSRIDAIYFKSERTEQIVNYYVDVKSIYYAIKSSHVLRMF